MNRQSAVQFPGNQRIHVALGVSDLAASRKFYQTLLGADPTKERPGYVKFEPQDPSVNLTLNERSNVAPANPGAAHFGIQVKSTDEVEQAIARFHAAGLKTLVEENTACCYAVQDKVWATDPDGNRWEVFVVLEADVAQESNEAFACCETESASAEQCC